MPSTRNTFVAVLLSGAVFVGCQSAVGGSVSSGAALYGTCEPCHGAAAEGQQSLGAPAIAGLESWYVQAQLNKFRDGVRGAHPDDAEGARMRPMARALKTPEQISAVAEYLAGLPTHRPEGALEGGDPAAGAASYAVCVACHGADGEGNEALNAPALAGQADWYLLAQLQKFRAGQRGADSRDVSGAQRRPMAMTLADEQAMKNVISHIQTLSP